MLRITGGAWRGRRLPEAVFGARPTPARVREALMNVWAHAGLLHEPFLDLFAGSGVMALEALSRGAPEAVSIEQRAASMHAMRGIAAQLGLESRWTIIMARLPAGLNEVAGRRFGVVFADPPYAWEGALRHIPGWLDVHGIGCDELAIEQPASRATVLPLGWRAADARRYGDTVIVRLTRA